MFYTTKKMTYNELLLTYGELIDDIVELNDSDKMEFCYVVLETDGDNYEFVDWFECEDEAEEHCEILNEGIE